MSIRMDFHPDRFKPCDRTRKCALLRRSCPTHGAWECCPHTCNLEVERQ